MVKITQYINNKNNGNLQYAFFSVPVYIPIHIGSSYGDVRCRKLDGQIGFNDIGGRLIFSAFIIFLYNTYLLYTTIYS